MARQNRVTPLGEIVATPARGTLMGNRGRLHDAQGVIRRTYLGQRWIICRLSFKGRRRPVMAPGQYTELFFLDEATALAAGHRPCAECQRERFERFRAIWATANPRPAHGLPPSAPALDAVLHAQRLTPSGRKRTFAAPAVHLPDGAFVLWPADSAGNPQADPLPYLVVDRWLLRWSPFGYSAAVARPESGDLPVLTPRSVVNALAAGYVADIHPSAEKLLFSHGTRQF